MAFDSLTEKLQNVFKGLRGKGRLSEKDVKDAMKEVKLALLEADVNFKVVKGFTNCSYRAMRRCEVLGGLNPAQTVIKIVDEELTSLMGSDITEIQYQPGQAITVIMMCGLQGAGRMKQKGKRPLLVACDVYRPAAIDQLKVNGEKQDVPVFSMGTDNSPVDIAKAAISHAKSNNQNVVILDTAGRLHVDDDMMKLSSSR